MPQCIDTIKLLSRCVRDARRVVFTVFPVEQLLDLLSKHHFLPHAVDVFVVCGMKSTA